MIRVGPAGWSYKDWEGVVYPKKKPRGFDPLEYLAQYFDALEINSTFYRPQPRSVTQQWLERVAPFASFRFTAKLNRRFTHERKESWTKDEVHEARDGLDAMHEANRLGAVLAQFPWSFKRGDAEQQWLRDLLQAFSGLPMVVEVRHDSWNTPDFFAELEERGVGFVNVDQPLFRHSVPPSARSTSHVGYVRVHGRNYHDWFRKDAGRDARYDYLYSPEQLEKWAERVRALADDEKTDEVYVVTNNHFRGQAVTNGLQLRSMLERRRVEVPRPLLDTYSEELRPFVAEQKPPQSGQAELF